MLEVRCIQYGNDRQGRIIQGFDPLIECNIVLDRDLDNQALYNEQGEAVGTATVKMREAYDELGDDCPNESELSNPEYLQVMAARKIPPEQIQNRMNERREKDRKRILANWVEATKRVSHGLIGLGKAALGIDAAPDDVAAARKSMCDKCPEQTSCIKDSKLKCCGKMTNAVTGAKTCGCVLVSKQKIASESCPLGEW